MSLKIASHVLINLTTALYTIYTALKNENIIPYDKKLDYIVLALLYVLSVIATTLASKSPSVTNSTDITTGITQIIEMLKNNNIALTEPIYNGDNIIIPKSSLTSEAPLQIGDYVINIQQTPRNDEAAITIDLTQ